MRLKIIRITIIFIFLTIILSLVYAQVIRGNYYYTLSRNNSIRVVSIDGKRGRILDRNGVMISDNRVAFDVMVVPQEVKDKEALFDYLGRILATDKGKVIKIYQQRMVSPVTPVVVAHDIEKEKAIILEENKFRFPGLLVQTSFTRYYPFGEINAHVVGYVGKINRSKITQLKDYGYTIQNIVGYSGVEEYYDRYLKGESGGRQIEVNNRGEQVRLLGLKEPASGQDITLTIDNRIQKVAMESLQGRKGAIVVMDLDNGEILGMVSSPTFDPNIFVDGRPELSALFSDSSAPLLNRVISGQYPPGSVFKVPLTIAALENHKIIPSTSFLCPGFYRLGQRQFNCSHSHGLQNLTEAIANSCNVYFFNTGLLAGPSLMMKYAKLFGLGDLTNIDLPYEARGLIPEKPQRRNARQQRWYEGDILNMSIGQGDILVTPLQLMRMMATVARNGEEINPHVIKSINAVEIKKNFSSRHINVDPKTFEIVRTGLKAAVGSYTGTAHILDIEGLSVFGKTGTAQTSGEYNNHAWFVGFCPEAKTKIVFCVFLEYGGSSYNACLVARDLLLGIKEEKIL